MSGLYMMPLKKILATGGTAQKELTPLEGSLDLAKLTCTGKKFTVGKNAAPDTTHAADAGQGDAI